MGEMGDFYFFVMVINEATPFSLCDALEHTNYYLLGEIFSIEKILNIFVKMFKVSDSTTSLCKLSQSFQ